jgi:hypothetical protein
MNPKNSRRSAMTILLNGFSVLFLFFITILLFSTARNNYLLHKKQLLCYNDGLSPKSKVAIFGAGGIFALIVLVIELLK